MKTQKEINKAVLNVIQAIVKETNKFDNITSQLNKIEYDTLCKFFEQIKEYIDGELEDTKHIPGKL